MLQLRYAIAAIVIAIGVFLGTMLAIELGRRLALRKLARPNATERTISTAGATVVYGLLSLLIGFSFNGAASRFDDRRQLVIQEVNTTGTAWERIDALPSEDQEPVRAQFRSYVDAVIAPELPDSHADALRSSTGIATAQHNVWATATQACFKPTGERARMLLLPSLNEMFGAVEKERLARLIHPPRAIFLMLAIATFAGGLFLGFGMTSGTERSWLHMIGVSATIAIAIYVIVELEYPRLGVLRVDAVDQVLVNLRSTLN